MAIQCSKTASNTLKILGIISMVVDHIGFVFFPQAVFLRIVGRLAFPIFAAGIANGYRHTSDLKQYALRLLVFGLVSQAPFMLVSAKFELNIFFTLLAGLGLIYFFDKKKYLFFAILAILPLAVPIEYGLFGVAVVFLFHILSSKRDILIAYFVMVLIYILLKANDAYLIYFFSLFGVAIVLYPGLLEKLKFPKLPKYFFYLFYPVHLALIAFVQYLRELCACF